ncbi:MAG: CHASE2 domain-containing protein [gamma proteobacterium endosymbiont of Lamellibrachia anaximandri]|nr:CHASE2 domain-containing protein [gamma proteobacterium endosymbiont of Lamellibrachia anaximandri]
MSRSAQVFRFPEWSLFALVGLILLLVYSNWLWRWDQLIYDLQLNLWHTPPAEDVVIVAVDDRSLQALGRWPWPRDLHARLIDRLTAAGAKVIAMDVLFAERDREHPERDRLLIQSTAASGRVFFPVVMEEYRLGGQLVETPPLPELSAVAAGLGHVHMELDADGIGRSIYLYEGVGAAYWPHMMLSVLQWLDPERWQKSRAELHQAQRQTAMQPIFRDQHRLIPFTGPAGHYPRYSYSQVLAGDFLPAAFQDRIVLVGVTATGLGDALPTPVSGHGQPMAGVEINANILEALRTERVLSLVEMPWRVLISGAVVAFVFLLYGLVRPHWAPLVTLALLFSLFGLVLLSLHVLRIWFPPSAVLLGLVLSYPLWSWRRLGQTIRYLNQEMEKLQQEPQLMPSAKSLEDLRQGLRFLQRITKLDGWMVCDTNGAPMFAEGTFPATESLPQGEAQWHSPGVWRRFGPDQWIRVPRGETSWMLGLRWPADEFPQGRVLLLLEDFAAKLSLPEKSPPRGTLESVDRRIEQVRHAHERLHNLRNFIENAISQMDDGLLVVDAMGQVAMANPRAAFYLGQSEAVSLVGMDAETLLSQLDIQGGYCWSELMQRLLLDEQPIRFEALRLPDTELFVQMKPLDQSLAGSFGMIVTLSFIGALKRTERTRARMLSFLSHDIRSPITSVLSLTQSRQATEGTAESLAKQIQPLAQRSLRLADDFLQLARAEAVDATTFADTDFVSVVYSAVDEIFIQVQSRNIRIDQQIDCEEAWLNGNAGILERAVQNLLGNAVKFSPEDSVITVHLTCLDSEIVCCIRDQGPGIAESQLETIFLPFQHGDQTTEYQRTGVGLGLSFVKVAVEKHGGTIEVCNSETGGAEFCLRLPFDPEL